MLFSTPVDCPDALAVDTRNGSCWVLDSCTGDLIHIAKAGGVDAVGIPRAPGVRVPVPRVAAARVALDALIDWTGRLP